MIQIEDNNYKNKIIKIYCRYSFIKIYKTLIQIL